MKKLIIMMVLGILLISMASAVVQFSQTDYYPVGFNHTTRTHASLFWYEGTYYGITDYIPDDEILEVYVGYSLYPQTWNTQNNDYEIVNCTFYINYFENLENQSYVMYSETITGEESDVLDKKYFVRLKNKDGFTSDIDCYFEDDDKRILDIPAEMVIVTPSYECKACQYYEWTLLQRDIEKARIIGENRVSVWDNIKGVVNLNYEVILAIFWFILILIALMGGGLIFVGIYWIFIYLRRLARDI